ncbi:MAG: preprotein translocase subunit YajC [Bdellovibrio sp.]|nr:MAG: preprotein translocase subunit YajC [Bdellovibrio sp.]
MLVIFYFFIIRPQGRKLKDHDRFLQGLKRGDAVITSSGLLGIIDGMTDAVVTLEIANGIKVKFLKKQIAGSQSQITSEKSSEKKS